MSVRGGDGHRAILACVPQLDPLIVQLHGAAQMFERGGVEARIERCAAGRMEVRVSFMLDDVQVEGGFDLAEWCASRIDCGDRLAFSEIDPLYLLPMLERDANATFRQLGGLPVAAWRAHEVLRPATPELRLRLRPGQGYPMLWFSISLSRWPMAYARWTRQTPWRTAFDPVPVSLALVVGRSQVTPGLMRRLVRGDVLLVQCRDWQVRVARAMLGVFSVSGQEWKMDAFARSRGRDNGTSARRAAETIGISMLDDVPVEVEFVLASHTLSLAELRMLHAGAVFPLTRPPMSRAGDSGSGCDDRTGDGSAAPASLSTPSDSDAGAQGYLVEVRLNGRTVAYGELVALGSQLAVQIARLSSEV
jgi:flagellar motor switch/type III secretory pathway protein FliN